MKLTDLKEASKPAFPTWTVVDGDIAVCRGYNIRNLKGIPFTPEFNGLSNFADISVDISDNKLTTLEGFPHFDSYRDIDASYNNLTSCKGLPRVIGGSLWIHQNKIESVSRDIVPYIDSLTDIAFRENPCENGPLLSLFKIKNLEYVGLENSQVQNIMNKYLKIKNRGRAEMLDCQSELIEAGYDEQAKL